MSNPPLVPVACAVIERDRLVLIAQRPPHKHLGLKWEFPGGKVEPGEQPADALVRELREELGCEVQILHALPPFVHEYESVRVQMAPFLCHLIANRAEPVAHEHLALLWVHPADLASFDFAEADLPIIAALLSRSAATSPARR